MISELKKGSCSWRKGNGKKALNLAKIGCVLSQSRIFRDEIPCNEKPPGCYDIWSDITIQKTWSCKGII